MSMQKHANGSLHTKDFSFVLFLKSAFRVILLLSVILVFTCQTGVPGETRANSNNIVPVSSVEVGESTESYILSADSDDIILGEQNIEIVSIDPLQMRSAGGSVEEADLGYFLPFVEEVIRRGFAPDRFVHYTNDSKKAESVVMYENGKIIFYMRIAERAGEGVEQHSIDFK